MGAILDLWKSERGLVAVALIAAATALCGFGVVPVEQWLDYTKWIFVTYAAAKTVTGSVAMASAQPKNSPDIMTAIVGMLHALSAERTGATKAESGPPKPAVSDAVVAAAAASTASAPTPVPSSPVSIVPPRAG
jgi:hypothetical protein